VEGGRGWKVEGGGRWKGVEGGRGWKVEGGGRWKGVYLYKGNVIGRINANREES